MREIFDAYAVKPLAEQWNNGTIIRVTIPIFQHSQIPRAPIFLAETRNLNPILLPFSCPEGRPLSLATSSARLRLFDFLVGQPSLQSGFPVQFLRLVVGGFLHLLQLDRHPGDLRVKANGTW